MSGLNSILIAFAYISISFCNAKTGLQFHGTSIVYRGSNDLKIKEQTLTNRWDYEIIGIGYYIMSNAVLINVNGSVVGYGENALSKAEMNNIGGDVCLFAT